MSLRPATNEVNNVSQHLTPNAKEWSMVNGQWSMVNNDPTPNTQHPTPPAQPLPPNTQHPLSGEVDDDGESEQSAAADAGCVRGRCGGDPLCKGPGVCPARDLAVQCRCLQYEDLCA